MAEPRVDKAEVLRYLGHKGQEYGAELDEVIDRSIELCLRLARPKHAVRILQIARETGGIRVCDADLLLTGEAIARHLDGVNDCALFAATLGVEVENRIRQLARGDLTASLALDAAATACIEAYCDDVCAELAAHVAARGLHPGPRFSPGYGDLPLELQPALLRELDAMRRIGLTCTESLILLPRKSVTAVIGLHGAPASACSSGCERCGSAESCEYQRNKSKK